MSPGNTFKELGLSGWIVRQLDSLGIKEPTPIQKNCIPPILEGKDCIGAAKTGSGKTLAFALPMLQTLCEEPYGIFALVLTPTRELAYQIRDNFFVVGKAINLRTCVIVGGMNVVEQGKELMRQPHVVVSTPGRMMDLLKTCNTFSLKRIKYLVIDEADRLLGGEFDDQMKVICDALPKVKQTLCFSATITSAIECLRSMTKNDVFQWEQASDVATVEELRQYYIACPEYVKDGFLVVTLRQFLEENKYASIIVFTSTCKECQLLSMMLKDIGNENVSLHGMMSQQLRLESLSKFKANQVKILVATDVASRGLDIPTVELVINHNIPLDPKIYIHRVGRTARAGKNGMAITLLCPNEINLIQAIEQTINIKLKEYTIEDKDVSKIFTEVSVSKRRNEVKLEQNNFYERREINKKKQLIMEGKDPNEVLGSSGSLLLKRPKKKRKLNHNKS